MNFWYPVEWDGAKAPTALHWNFFLFENVYILGAGRNLMAVIRPKLLIEKKREREKLRPNT